MQAYLPQFKLPSLSGSTGFLPNACWQCGPPVFNEVRSHLQEACLWGAEKCCELLQLAVNETCMEYDLLKIPSPSRTIFFICRDSVETPVTSNQAKRSSLIHILLLQDGFFATLHPVVTRPIRVKQGCTFLPLWSALLTHVAMRSYAHRHLEKMVLLQAHNASLYTSLTQNI